MKIFFYLTSMLTLSCVGMSMSRSFDFRFLTDNRMHADENNLVASNEKQISLKKQFEDMKDSTCTECGENEQTEEDQSSKEEFEEMKENSCLKGQCEDEKCDEK